MQYPCHSRHHTLSPLPRWHQPLPALLSAAHDAIEMSIEMSIFDSVVVQEGVVEVELETAEGSLLSGWTAGEGAVHGSSASL